MQSSVFRTYQRHHVMRGLEMLRGITSDPVAWQFLHTCYAQAMTLAPYKFLRFEPIFNGLRDNAISEVITAPVRKSMSPQVLAPGEPIERAIPDLNAPAALHNFGMPSACQIYADAVLQSLVSIFWVFKIKALLTNLQQEALKTHFSSQGLAVLVTSPAHQATTQLNQNSTFLLLKDRINLLLPIFANACTAVFEQVDPLLMRLLEHAAEWRPDEVLCLQNDIGFSVPGGNIRFVLSDYPKNQNSSNAATTWRVPGLSNKLYICARLCLMLVGTKAWLWSHLAHPTFPLRLEFTKSGIEMLAESQIWGGVDALANISCLM
jgi:hypothetical protein